MSSINYQICAICGINDPEPKHYYCAHKLKEAVYFETYYPKRDRLTGEKINFKNREQYILCDFSNRNNLKKWFKLQRNDIKQEYLRDILLKRKNIKKWKFIPTQVELRSSDGLVGIKTYNEVFGNYYSLCEELGFKSRGLSNINERTILKKTRDIHNHTILVDSREQQWISFKDIEIATLPVGDYTLKENNYNIFVERKSVSDFLGTIGKNGIDRFKRELQKAQELNSYVIMLVEESLINVLSFEYKPYIARHTKATAAYIFHNLREIIQEYPNFQVAFCDGKKDMAAKIKWIFELGENIKHIDIQLAIDIGLFTDGI